jgi:hypothetical protein
MWDRIQYEVLERLGYALCELAFKTHCFGPFALTYRAGCWCYGKGDDAGIRCGALVANLAYRAGIGEPLYIPK